MPDIVTRMVLRGWGVRVVVVSAIAVLASGCTGDGDAEVTPTPILTAPVIESPEPSPSPTPSPTPTALTEEEILAAIPPGAQNEDFYSAQLFAEFFMQLSQDVLTTADLSLLNALSTADCVFCQNTRDVVSRMVADGAIATGGELISKDTLAQGGLQEDGDWRVVFDAAVAERKFVDGNGSVVSSTPAEEVEVTVVLTRDSGYWKVVDVASQEVQN